MCLNGSSVGKTFADRQRRSAEVRCMVEGNGWDFAEACNEAGIDPASFHQLALQNDRSAGVVLPTPAEIEAITQAIRRGDIVFSHYRAEAWEAVADELNWTSKSEQEQQAAFDLAARLPEDAVVVPAWFNVAGRSNEKS